MLKGGGKKRRAEKGKKNLRGTQLPNFSGYSEIRSSFILSLRGPNMMTGLAQVTENAAELEFINSRGNILTERTIDTTILIKKDKKQ